MLSTFARRSFSLSFRYTNATDLPQGQDTFIARWDINNIPAGCGKEKLKIKMDMHGLLSVVGAQALEETKEEVPDAPSADAAAAAGMEVEKVEHVTLNAAQEAAQAASDEKKKRKYKKHEIGFDAQFAGGLSADGLKQGTDVEAAQALADRVFAETAEKRNEVEAFIYESRTDLETDLAPFLTAEAIASFGKQLDAAEQWLDEVRDQEVAPQKSDYVRKLAELKALGEPAQRRRGESKNRGSSVSALKSALTKYRLQAASPDAKYAHIDAADKARITAECETVEAWLQTATGQQDARAATEDPAFTCAECDGKRAALERLADPIMSRPVPKPAPAPAAPAAADAPMPDAGAAAAAAAAAASAAAAATAKAEADVTASGAKMDLD